MNKTKFGSYIKESRIKKNYTQQDLADLLFVDVSTVSKWERGINYPDITLVPDICRVLEISEHELIESSHDLEYRKMKKEADKYNNIKKRIFWTLNICYVVALLTCFVVNIAINHTLSWFFIVLASILCSYSFCPTITWMFGRYKKLVFIGSTFVSLFLLFLTCSVYTSNYWFMIATLGVLLGYFIFLYPFLFKSQRKYLDEGKYGKFSKWFMFSYFMGIFVMVSLLLIVVYVYAPFNLLVGLLITGGVFMVPILLGILNLFEVGKTLNKPILLSLVGVIALFLIIGLGRSIYLKSTEVTKSYNIMDIYSDIRIERGTFDVNVYMSQDNENKVVYLENKKVTFEIKMIDGVLTIKQNDNRKFYDNICNFSHFRVDLYLTKETIDTLNIEGSVGDIKVNKGFTFNEVNISNSTGNIELESDVLNDLKIRNSTGNIKIQNIKVGGKSSIETETGDIEFVNVIFNDLDIEVSTGDTKLESVLVNEDFNMKGSTGDLLFNEFDARNIYVELSTGDVKGTILTNKIFNVKSETGKIEVPETYTGGICKIVVSTGNVKISYK